MHLAMTTETPNSDFTPNSFTESGTGTHSLSFSLRSEAPGRLTKEVRQYGPLKPFECMPAPDRRFSSCPNPRLRYAPVAYG
jgi:hypothetical protein